ncbi:MAG: D-alanyl-D-alanine carboxypeptidase/D-alanyl-D-alanine-endopeptidase [Saprospiraceae bacterium]|nr:D-alanyl-D-alanine carboxypeptidase/D-alanyl-D-alanine-endopeptidase [Pyrinomonadaceae bacterium]
MKVKFTWPTFILLPLAAVLFLGVLTDASAQNDTRPGSAAPTPTPIPSVIVTPAATPNPLISGAQNLVDLQSRIRLRLARPEVRRGQIGVKIVSLNTGKVIFEENAEKYFMPASNMKNFTVAATLEKLTPDFRFVTSVYAAAMPDSGGKITGDLRIFGRGDVSISTAFNNGDYFKGLDNLADKIVQAGVKRIEGNLIGDESYFAGHHVPGSWEYEDLQWYYGAEISALPLNDNALDLSVTPGPAGYQCSVRITPGNVVMRVVNQCLTSAAGSERTLQILKKVDQNILEITGSLPSGNAGFKGSITVSRPADLFVSLLKQRLELKGVTITGTYRTEKTRSPTPLNTGIEIAKLESPPLSLIAAKTMKPSQNMYTETLLWTLGEETRKLSQTPVSTGQTDSSELGLAAVKSFLNEIGVAPDGIIQHDGSGLSRHNLITPGAVVRLYTYMGSQSRFSADWRNSLTIGGVDGTLANRFKGTAAAGNIRGKTGTIDQVSALSGYVTTAAGEQLVLSIVVNGVNVPRERTSLIDEIVLNLANFNGRIDQ